MARPDQVGNLMVGEAPAYLVNMNYLTKEQLLKLSTQRLLAYKNKLLRATAGPNWGEDVSVGMNRSQPEWQKAYQTVKDILATRENVIK